ncbi:hypothetical protein LUW77_10695 [Streptomyces radiopugnans]|nr:hypothetical protein LUW77_10695 [Streptomyces radiopugnans]
MRVKPGSSETRCLLSSTLVPMVSGSARLMPYAWRRASASRPVMFSRDALSWLRIWTRSSSGRVAVCSSSRSRSSR